MRYVSKQIEIEVIEITEDSEMTRKELRKHNISFRLVRPHSHHKNAGKMMFDIHTINGVKRAVVGEFLLIKEGNLPALMSEEELHTHFKPVTEVPVLHAVPKRLEDWLGKRSMGDPLFTVRKETFSQKPRHYFYDYKYRKMDDPK